MLTRSSQIGEFYVMSPPQVRPSDGNSRFSCDMMLYDEESDRHVRIPWKDALGACLLDDPKLKQPEVKVANGANSTMKIADWLKQATEWATYNEEEYKSTEEANAGYLACAAKGGADIRIVVARPFIEHLMHNAILTVAGRDTGATLFGPADMQLSANTQVKTIEGHYTGHFKAVVTKPQNVMVMRDVACAGYVAGCNTRWFARDEENKPDGDKSFSAGSAQGNIQSRLSFDDDMTDRYASMLAFPAHEGQFEGGQLDTVMSITTRLLPWEVNGSGQHNSFPGGDAMYKAYSGILGLSSVHYGEDMKAAENQDFISQGTLAFESCLHF